MSGTSLDGIDAALIKTDGHEFIQPCGFITTPYSKELQDKLRACLGKKQDADGEIAETADLLTRTHADAAKGLLSETGYKASEIDLIGFHGHTIHHDPDNHFTWQIGNGALLAQLTGIDVVNDLRSADVKAGGQGAPLLPLYHKARLATAGKPFPAAIVNIGGVGNITYVSENDILAFDTGPGNALIDDWIRTHTDQTYDHNGDIARKGQVNEALLKDWLSVPYFKRPPPKSLDRADWHTAGLDGLSVEDGAATLAAFTVSSIAAAETHLPGKPHSYYITGGGRHNSYIMDGLRAALHGHIAPVEELGWNGDSVEAEGFAYFAVRSRLGLLITFPGTTGCPAPMSGGEYHPAA